MANKSFIVQYIIKARDQASAAAEKTRRAFKGMREGIAKTRKAFVKNAREIRNAGAWMVAGVTVPIGFAVNAMKNAARDAEETRSKFAHVFKGINKEAESVADTFAKSFGLAGTTARDLIGDSGDLLTGLGLTRKEALRVSVQMNTLAADLASLKNFQGGAAGAANAMLRAMIGEREALKGLGIALNEKMVMDKMAAMYAAGTNAKSLQHLKILATLALVTTQAKNSVGDYARTKEELANQERRTAQEMIKFNEIFGKILVPIMIKMNKVAQATLQWFTDLSPTTKKAALVIAGLAAVLGPLLLVIGSLGLALPYLAAGFAAIGVAFAAAFGITGSLVMVLAGAAYLIVDNWGAVKDFFISLKEVIAPIFDYVVDFIYKFSGLKDVVEAFKTLNTEGWLTLPDIGGVVGKLEGLAAEFMVNTGLDARTAVPIALPRQRVDVGVSVGLDPGLKQTGAVNILGQGTRRGDVGAM